jgi:hypothetical protein
VSINIHTRWFKYDRDDLCVNKSQFVPVISELPCTCSFFIITKYDVRFIVWDGSTSCNLFIPQYGHLYYYYYYWQCLLITGL